MFECESTVAHSSALPGLVLVESLTAKGTPADGRVGVTLKIAGEELFLTPYRIRELKSMLALAEKSVERQQEKIFLEKNLTLDF